MRHHIVGTLAATVLAAPLAAQAPASPQQGPAAAQPEYQHQLVTVEGCLRRDHVPQDAALELAADPDRGLVFVLTSAEVRSRIDTMPAPAPPAEGDVAPGPAAIQNERAGVPTAERPADKTRNDPGVALEGEPTPAADRYVVIGLEDDRLRLFAGQRVAMTGQFEPAAARVDPSPDGNGGGTAGVPRARTDTPAPQSESAVGTTGRTAAPLTLPQFRATSIKPVPGICPPKP